MQPASFDIEPKSKPISLAEEAWQRHRHQPTQTSNQKLRQIDWGNSRAPTHRPPAALSVGACGAIITYSLIATGLDMDSASAILYNVSVIFILAGCAFTIADILLSGSTLLTAAVRIAAIWPGCTASALLRRAHHQGIHQ
ncbi:MAG: hypothetical protein U5O39_19250 [Gammaproteobacteria bacterium]|nr:hypothetical protein [Gammaproteobacteria bacterium]